MRQDGNKRENKMKNNIAKGGFSHKKVLIIDNYDSFTYNIVYLLSTLGIKPQIVPNDTPLLHLKKLIFSHLIISPGPSHPLDSGVCLEAIKTFAPTHKILGICLGHQCIAQAFGGEVISMPNPTHAKSAGLHFVPNPLFVAPTHKILGICLGHQCIAQAFGGEVISMPNPTHAKSAGLHFVPNPLFEGIPQGIQVALYHSLYVSKLGECEALGYSEHNVLMVLKAKGYDCYGVQFHPESILQQKGKRLMKNFLALD